MDILQGVTFSGGWWILAGCVATATAVLVGLCALCQSEDTVGPAAQDRNEEPRRRTDNPLNGVAALFGPVSIPTTDNISWRDTKHLRAR